MSILFSNGQTVIRWRELCWVPGGSALLLRRNRRALGVGTSFRSSHAQLAPRLRATPSGDSIELGKKGRLQRSHRALNSPILAHSPSLTAGAFCLPAVSNTARSQIGRAHV